MQLLTKKTLKKILKATDHVVVAEDFDDIEALDRLADKVAGVSSKERRLLNSPFDLCGVKFYPLTIAKTMWYEEKIEAWGVTGTLQQAMLFWLLTLPLTSEALDEYSTRKKADRAAKKLARKMHCTPDEMTVVYNKCLSKEDRADTSGGDGSNDDEDGLDYGGVIACLIREYGGTPDQWLYETPVEEMSALFEQFEKRIIAEENAHQSASASTGKAIAPTVTRRMIALGDFNDKARSIEKKWSVTNGE